MSYLEKPRGGNEGEVAKGRQPRGSNQGEVAKER